MKTVRKDCGSYELILEWKNGITGQIEIDYAQDTDNVSHAVLRISSSGIEMLLRTCGGEQTLRRDTYVPREKLIFLRRGSYARALYDGRELWMQGGTGEWCDHYTAEKAVLTIDDTGNDLTSCLYSPLNWLPAPDAPAVSAGKDGTFYEQQIIDGAVLEYEGTWYMYCMCGIRGEEEGSARRVIGVAVSEDLMHWTVLQKPFIDSGVLGVKGENLYPNACIRTDEGKIYLFFSAQSFPEWIGVYALDSDSPLGPFVPCGDDPVVPPIPGRPQHEFDAVRCDLPQGRYLMYLTTYTPCQDGQRSGDRGFLYFSDDLVHWRADKDIPPFAPETADGWDAAHVRTRSLTRIGDTWYLWYEGTNHWTPPNNPAGGAFVNQEWWDVVGLARSTDLKNWEYYPRNPCLVPQGRSYGRYDSRWTGWPRMVIRDGKGYIFHSASGPKVHIGCRTIDIADLINWETEGGKTERLI